MLIDSHCHLNIIANETEHYHAMTQEEIAKVKEIVTTAANADVQRIITIGTNVLDSNDCAQLAHKIENVYAAVGIHPTETRASWREDLAEIKKLLSHKKIVAIGECGLDFYWKPYNAQLQKDAFKAQIELALESNRALVIHSRSAYEETLKMIESYQNSLSRVVMHCFSENLAAAQELTSRGILLGITGTITYPKNEELRSIIKTIGLKHIVLETDAPFLPPQIIRGKKNHPQYIAAIAHYIAQYLEISYDEVAQYTTENAERLFAL